LGIHENSLPTVDSSNIYNFEEIELSEHQPSARLLQIQKKKSTRRLVHLPFLRVEIRALIGAHHQKLQVPKVLFPALQIDFFSGALCHSTSSSLFEGFLDAPGSSLLHALLKSID